MFTLLTTETNQGSSANSFAFDKSSMRLFMYIRSRNEPNVKPQETHALTSAKEEAFPSSATFCFLFLKKLNNEFKMLSDVPFCFSLQQFIKYFKIVMHSLYQKEQNVMIFANYF